MQATLFVADVVLWKYPIVLSVFVRADLAAMIVSVLQGAYVVARAENSEVPFKRAMSGLLFTLGTLTKAAI